MCKEYDKCVKGKRALILKWYKIFGVFGFRAITLYAIWRSRPSFRKPICFALAQKFQSLPSDCFGFCCGAPPPSSPRSWLWSIPALSRWSIPRLALAWCPRALAPVRYAELHPTISVTRPDTWRSIPPNSSVIDLSKKTLPRNAPLSLQKWKYFALDVK